MPTPPLKPPETDANDKAGTPGSPVRAILTGLAVDIGGSILLSVLLAMLYHSQLVSSGMTPDQVDAAMDDIPLDSPIQMIGILLGAGCSVLGGYVCARIVRRDEWRVGGIMALASALLSLAESSHTPDDLVVLLTLSTLACVMLGVKYGRERNRRAPPPPPGGEPGP